MLETPHVIVGAVIATKIANPALAIPLAFTSHLVLEKVPHWNPHLDTELKKYDRITKTTLNFIIVDSTLALITGAYIAALTLPNISHFLTVMAASFAAALPDLMSAPYYFLKTKNSFIKYWVKSQKRIQENTSALPGLATQIITIIIAFWWLRS